MTTKKTFFALILSAMMCVPFTMSAQVTIGSGNPPTEWSLLYLCTYYQKKALHNARMTTDQRNALMCYSDLNIHSLEDQTRAQGLMIFNTDAMGDVGCLEFWNGRQWISLCESRLPWLRVNPDTWTFPSGGGTHTFNVDTSARTWSVSWVNADGTPASEPAGFTLVYDIANNIFTVTAGNNPDAMRTGIIAVTAGGLTEHVTVIQWGTEISITAMNNNPFVGAFWRNNQRGERLIRISHSGVWTAFATEDWIQLDRGVEGNMMTWEMSGTEYLVCMTTQDHLHRLPSTAGGQVSGTGNIYFRIGLDSYNENPVNPRNRTPDNQNGREPRWGQVIVVHSEGTHIIWIRQGEDTAELMRVGDFPNANANVLRTTANAHRIRSFSPFNLTAEQLNVQVGTRAQQLDAGFDGNRSIFVQYPTQTGALWQWAGSLLGAGRTHRMPWNPVTPTNAPEGWIGNNIPDTNWYADAGTPNLMTNHETCPPGFRRPRDGDPWGDWLSSPLLNNTAAMIRASEMRQSLFLQPQVGAFTSNRENSVLGFYADGFFDRRVRTQSNGHINAATPLQNRTVAAGTTQVANIGVLFFNTESGASLFLPMAGGRNSSGSIAGGGRYWSSTQGTQWSSAWALRIYSYRIGHGHEERNWHRAEMNDLIRGEALSVRCVAE